MEKREISKREFSFEWLLQGSLARLGDIVDRFTGRKEGLPNSLATSQLTERLKRLIDEEIKEGPEMSKIAPHIIRLRVQWDKFAVDENDNVDRLQKELLAAAIDHINDSRYYTIAPVDLTVSSDYFTEGIKLSVSFDNDDQKGNGVDLTVPDIRVAGDIQESMKASSEIEALQVHILTGSVGKSLTLPVPISGRLTVGRGAANHVVVDHPSVSKFHGSISIADNGSVSVADTGSTNGTFVGARRIAYGKSVNVGKDDLVKFGSVEVQLRVLPGEAGEVRLATHENLNKKSMKQGTGSASSPVDLDNSLTADVSSEPIPDTKNQENG